jgi:hypothetical protein
MAKSTKLELTWIGKENRLRLEPRARHLRQSRRLEKLWSPSKGLESQNHV